MSWVKAILREVFGLFFDDIRFALTIVVWLLIVGLMLPRLEIAPAWTGLLLFIGLAGILLESTCRRGKRAG